VCYVQAQEMRSNDVTPSGGCACIVLLLHLFILRPLLFFFFSFLPFSFWCIDSLPAGLTSQKEREIKNKTHRDEQRKKSVGLTTVERTVVGDLWPERPWKRLDYRWYIRMCVLFNSRVMSLRAWCPLLRHRFLSRGWPKRWANVLLRLYVCI